jgi:hypothetical protein
VRKLIAVAVLVLAGGLSTGVAQAQTFDHSAFDALLRANVVDGMVDYEAFRKAPTFPTYLDSLNKAEIAKLDPKELLAYWINTYNAYTIQLILSHNEKESIRNFNKSMGIAGHGPWREKLVKAGGQIYHLDNVEQDIIRKDYFTKVAKEPRIHFALVCAAMGCPPLRSEAYTGAKLDAQLNDQAATFLLKSPIKNHVDLKTGTLYGSQIFVKYYPEDFGQTPPAITKYLAAFYPDGPEKQLLLGGKAKLVETDYDWTLNSQEKAKAPKPAAK